MERDFPLDKNIMPAGLRCFHKTVVYIPCYVLYCPKKKDITCIFIQQGMTTGRLMKLDPSILDISIAELLDH